MRHPFQRASNDKDTVRTPFQAALVRFIEAYSDEGDRMSGRKLSNLLGKSANHISQMLNDGFVPSGVLVYSRCIDGSLRCIDVIEAKQVRF